MQDPKANTPERSRKQTYFLHDALQNQAPHVKTKLIQKGSKMSLSYKHTEQDSKAKQRQNSVRPQSNFPLNGHKPTKSNGTTTGQN